MRLVSAVMMLVLIGALMMRFRDPSMWRWVGGSDETLAPHTVAPRTTAVAHGKTDEDPDEQHAASREFQAVTDRTMEIGKLDMPAYLRLLRWVDRQSEQQLRKRASTDIYFTDLIQLPEKHRGQLITLNLNIRRIRQYEGPAERPEPIYEVWGFTQESKAWLYVAVVPELPAGMPIGPAIAENARLTGYFFKVQGFQDGLGKQSYAPLLIGRLEWQPPTPTCVSPYDWLWGVTGVCLMVFIGVASFFFAVFRQRRGSPKSTWAGRPRAEDLQWLDPALPDDLPTPSGDLSSDSSNDVRYDKE